MPALTDTAPATAGAGTGSLLAKLGAGTSIAAILAAVAIAVRPASETEKAGDDGERSGTAVAQLQSADTTAEVDDALVRLHDLDQAELDVAVDDPSDNAEDVRTTGPEIQQSFWDGYRHGLDS